jgi:hypothetical protein
MMPRQVRGRAYGGRSARWADGIRLDRRGGACDEDRSPCCWGERLEMLVSEDRSTMGGRNAWANQSGRCP